MGILLWEAGILCHEWEQEAEEGLLKHGAGKGVERWDLFIQ